MVVQNQENNGELKGFVNLKFEKPKKDENFTSFNQQEQNMETKQKFTNTKREIPLKIVPLGGLEQVGENMMFLEYRGDIIIIDA
jgi:mRNA degradation ribonuclease J1/J2